MHSPVPSRGGTGQKIWKVGRDGTGRDDYTKFAGRDGTDYHKIIPPMKSIVTASYNDIFERNSTRNDKIERLSTSCCFTRNNYFPRISHLFYRVRVDWSLDTAHTVFIWLHLSGKIYCYWNFRFCHHVLQRTFRNQSPQHSLVWNWFLDANLSFSSQQCNARLMLLDQFLDKTFLTKNAYQAEIQQLLLFFLLLCVIIVISQSRSDYYSELFCSLSSLEEHSTEILVRLYHSFILFSSLY